MKLAGIWAFIAGESRVAPAAVAAAVLAALVCLRVAPLAPFAGAVLLALVVAGLVRSVFERR